MTAGIANQKQLKNRPPRRKTSANRQMMTTPVSIVSVTKAASVMTIVLNQPVALKGVPALTTNLAWVTATAANLTSPTTLALTFSAAITTATSLVTPFEDPALRNASGGYLNPGTFPV